MLAVSLYLPEIHRRRLVHHRVPDTLEGLFSEVADLLEHLHRNPADPEELQSDSLRLKSQLSELTRAVDGSLDQAGSRQATLSAMTGGMFAGALDGVLLYGHRIVTSQPPIQSETEKLTRSWGTLWKNLSQVLEVGQSSWGQAHVDDLQLLSGYGKHENRNSLSEGEAMQARSGGDRLDFQTFLMASFKGGYAMGVVDAAVMYVGRERPGAPAI